MLFIAAVYCNSLLDFLHKRNSITQKNIEITYSVYLYALFISEAAALQADITPEEKASIMGSAATSTYTLKAIATFPALQQQYKENRQRLISNGVHTLNLSERFRFFAALKEHVEILHVDTDKPEFDGFLAL